MFGTISKVAAAGVLMAAVGAMAGCKDHYGKGSGGYGASKPVYGAECTKVPPTPVPVSQNATPSEIAACEAAGGTVGPGGLAGFDQCVLPFCDAGEVCSDSSECVGNCYTGPGFAGGSGTPTTGFCQPNSSPFGCRTEVVGGVAGPTICVD